MMTKDLSSRSFAERAQRYFARAFGADNLCVRQAMQVMGGISRQTWRVDVAWQASDGTSVERSLIVRIDPPSSLLESGRRVEYAMYRAFWHAPGVPVPEPLFIEDDPEPLGMPFMVVAMLDGVAGQTAILQPEYQEGGPRLVRQVFEILGSIAAADYRDLGLEGIVPAPSLDDVWALQLDHWEKQIRDNSLGPLPITSAVIRWLRREPPPPPSRLSVVHGDYHFGNWLYTPEHIVGILDWEMAHLGDRHEDLAWALLKNWRSGSQPKKIMQFLDPEEAISVWEHACGLRVDHDALRWWTLFSHLKALAIWANGAFRFTTGIGAPLIYAATGWKNMSRQELWMLEDMGVLSC